MEMRRAANKRSVIERADGSYEARLWIPAPEGSDAPARRVARRARTRREAAAKLAELRRTAATGAEQAEALRVSNRTTLAAWFPRWEAALAADVADGRLRAKTATDYSASVRLHVPPRLGGRAVSSIRPSDARALSGRLAAAGHSDNSRRLIAIGLRKCLAAAAADGLVAPAVVAGVPVPRARPTGVRPTPTSTQVRELLAQVRGDVEADVLPALLVLLAAVSGARRGELVGPRWADIEDGL
jgi:integrase